MAYEFGSHDISLLLTLRQLNYLKLPQRKKKKGAFNVRLRIK